MSLSRDCRLPIVLAAALLACGMCCGQEAPGDQKKQPKIYTIRPSDERDIRPVAPSTLPSRSQQPTDGQAPAPARSRGVPAGREKSATLAETAAWIRQLDAAEFETRETA